MIKGDVNMAEGLSNTKNIIKIGYLNKKDEKMIEKYNNSFDIVLIEDTTFNIPNEILNYINLVKI